MWGGSDGTVETPHESCMNQTDSVIQCDSVHETDGQGDSVGLNFFWGGGGNRCYKP